MSDAGAKLFLKLQENKLKVGPVLKSQITVQTSCKRPKEKTLQLHSCGSIMIGHFQLSVHENKIKTALNVNYTFGAGIIRPVSLLKEPLRKERSKTTTELMNRVNVSEVNSPFCGTFPGDPLAFWFQSKQINMKL